MYRLKGYDTSPGLQPGGVLALNVSKNIRCGVSFCDSTIFILVTRSSQAKQPDQVEETTELSLNEDGL